MFTLLNKILLWREHWHLLLVARALRIQSNVPLCYWGDYILIAVHIINRLPSPILQNKSPIELVFHIKPSYDYLRVFGCLCYSSTISTQRDKFQPRSQACVLLGYPLATKGYKLLNLTSRKIFISRDVIFHESIFPFISLDSVYSTPSATSLPPVSDSTLTTLPFNSTSSPVFHDSFINDQNFAFDVDSDSNIDDDAPSSSPFDSLHGAHLADLISLAPSSPISAATSSNDSHIPSSIPRTTLPANSQPATLPTASSLVHSISQLVPSDEPPLVV